MCGCDSFDKHTHRRRCNCLGQGGATNPHNCQHAPHCTGGTACRPRNARSSSFSACPVSCRCVRAQAPRMKRCSCGWSAPEPQLSRRSRAPAMHASAGVSTLLSCCWQHRRRETTFNAASLKSQQHPPCLRPSCGGPPRGPAKHQPRHRLWVLIDLDRLPVMDAF